MQALSCVREIKTGVPLQDTLVSLAKAVANATATLVLKAKAVASHCDNQQTQNTVIHSATQCALATSQLVACTKVSGGYRRLKCNVGMF